MKNKIKKLIFPLCIIFSLCILCCTYYSSFFQVIRILNKKYSVNIKSKKINIKGNQQQSFLYIWGTPKKDMVVLECDAAQYNYIYYPHLFGCSNDKLIPKADYILCHKVLFSDLCLYLTFYGMNTKYKEIGTIENYSIYKLTKREKLCN